MDADVGPSTSNQAAPTEPHAMAAKGSTQGPQRVSGRVGVKGGGCAAAGGSRAAGLGGRGQASGGVQGRPGGQGSDGSGGSGSDTSSEEGGNGRLAPGEEDQLYDEGAGGRGGRVGYGRVKRSCAAGGPGEAHALEGGRSVEVGG